MALVVLDSKRVVSWVVWHGQIAMLHIVVAKYGSVSGVGIGAGGGSGLLERKGEEVLHRGQMRSKFVCTGGPCVTC